MNVVAFNGSPRTDGNTALLVKVVFDQLHEHGIETERVDICPAHPRGCTACMGCFKNRDGKCVVTTDPMNEWIEKMVEAEGIILASPTYFANCSSEMKALVDRAGLVAKANDDLLKHKVGAAVVAVRRAGALPTFDAMNHLFGISQMVTVGSSYWNHGIGMAPGEAAGDDEGLKTMVNLGANMAWALQKLHG